MMIMLVQFFCSFIFLSLSLLGAAQPQSKCNHQAEISALLQFKAGFEINCTDRYGRHYMGYPKTSSWSIDNLNSIEWDGVECDRVTGHVIGLDLSSSCLRGSIKSIIFSLVHLEHLNLAFNDFTSSKIPRELGNLSRLTHLNLSSSYFTGRVPLEISKLSMLSSLDLSTSPYFARGNLDVINLNGILQNLTNLEELDLSSANIISKVPNILTNMSSLRSLKLEFCRLNGEFPQGIFHLPNLQQPSIKGNVELNGHLPDHFNWSTPLESLTVSITRFNGSIPASIGNLVSLTELDLSGNGFSGSIPASIVNLSFLRKLDLSNCELSGPIPALLGDLTQLIHLDLASYTFPDDFNSVSLSWVGNLTNLRYLSISYAMNLKGRIPPSFANLINISTLYLDGNQFTEEIPPWLTNFTQLSKLDLSDNHLTGEIPINMAKLTVLDLSNNKLQGDLLPIQNLRNLEYLDVSNNNLSGSLELDVFFEFTNLTNLVLSSNSLTLLQTTSSIRPSRLLSLGVLGLSSCQLSKFPEFLRGQHDLFFVDLSDNSITGEIPIWMGNVSVNSLQHLNLSHNLITGFGTSQINLPWLYLETLDVSFNKLQGSILNPPVSVLYYLASNNELIGEIPHSICNSTSLQVLDLSSNRFTGELYNCFSNFSNLEALNLRNNSFHGAIPNFCESEADLFAMIDLSTNRFQGKIPRSLANCFDLQFFDVGSNMIYDTFPSWLGSLLMLEVIILRDNAIHGLMEMPQSRGLLFPALRIIDISRNNLSGKLPSSYFEQWYAMMDNTSSYPGYMEQSLLEFIYSSTYYYSLTISTKSVDREYLKIFNALIAIDLSSNRFEGEIPSTICDLVGLRFLNLSNNHLTGGIPSSLGMLTRLESLDLSSNKLSMQIPHQLTQLTSLAVFNVSYNNLTGPIPQGEQFNTFPNNSYVGNPGLCGYPLSKGCENSHPVEPQQPALHEEMNLHGENIDWMVVMIGFAGGLAVGVAIENIVDVRKPVLSFWIRRN